MTSPAIPSAETIRTARASVATDIARSRRRVSELSALLRAEAAQLANLQAIAEVVGVTDVASDKAPDVVDAGVETPDGATPNAPALVFGAGGRGNIALCRDAEAPPAGTPTGP